MLIPAGMFAALSLGQAALGILALLGSSGFAVIVVKLLERKKTGAEANKLSAEANMTDAQATDILTRASNDVVEMLGEQLRAAFERIAHLEHASLHKDQMIADLRTELGELRLQIARNHKGKD